MAILEDCVILKAHDYVAKFLDKCPWMRDIIIVIKVLLSCDISHFLGVADPTRISMGY